MNKVLEFPLADNRNGTAQTPTSRSAFFHIDIDTDS